MNKFLYTLIALLFTISAFGQLDRSIRPEAGPAPKVNIGEYESFTLSNGLKVYVIENNKIPAVSYNLYLDINPIKEGNKAGYTNLAGELLKSGTKKRTKDEIDESVDFIGAQLYTSSNGLYARALKSHNEELLEIVSDVLLNPTFPQEEIDKSLRQLETSLQADKNEPSVIASNITKSLIYGKDDPYGEMTTEESIKNITQKDLIDYHTKYFKPNIGYLIIIGDITKQEAEKQAKKYFGKWKKGTVKQDSYDLPKEFDAPMIVVGNKDGGNQSTIRVSHTVPLQIGHPDVIKASVMNQTLGGGSFSARLLQNLREDKAYTYGAYSRINPDRRIGSFSAMAQVRSEVTDSALTEMLYEIREIRTNLVKDEELELVKNMMTGSFSRSLEDPRTVAGFALNIARFNLPNDYYETYLEKLNAVTKEDVLEMAQKYLKPENALVLAVGNVDAIKESMKKFSPNGEVKEYDFYGNEVIKSDVEIDITAEEVINKYIDAIGGKDALSKVNSLVTNSSFSTQGMEIQIVIHQKESEKLLVETKMMGNLMAKQVFDGEKGVVASPMGEQEIEGDDLISLKASAVIFPELNYKELGYTLKIREIESVDGKDAYKIAITNPAGNTSVHFFDVETGLRVKEINDSEQGSSVIIYKKYDIVDGVKFPFEFDQSMAGQLLEMKVSEILINSEIEDSIFEL